MVRRVPDVLTIQRPPRFSPLDFVRVVIVSAAPAYLAWLWYRGRLLHFDDPSLNAAAHAALVVMGILAGACLVSQSVQADAPNERLIHASAYGRDPRGSVWMFLPLLPALGVGVAILVDQIIAHRSQAAMAALVTSPLRAGLIWGTAFGLTLLYLALLNDREELRVSDEGLRVGMTQFIEWANVDHWADRGTRIELYHRAQPGLFFIAIPATQDVKNEVGAYLARHAVPRDDAIPALLRRTRRLSTLYSVAIFIGGLLVYWLRIRGPFSTIAATLLMGFIGVFVIDRVRRLGKTTRTKHERQRAPPQPAAAAAAIPGAAQTPVDPMVAAARHAVNVARDQYSVALDYSPPSVRLVESILTRIHDASLRRQLDDAKLTDEARLWGAYVGAVLLRIRTGAWVFSDDEDPFVELKAGSIVFPIDWCAKRLRNGPEDDVWLRFQVLLATPEWAANSDQPR
jgi:hypothetical protein